MKKQTISVLVIMICFFSFTKTEAQNYEIKPIDHSIDAAIGVGEGTFSSALSWNRTHGLFESKKLRLGYGLRFSMLGGQNLNYTTAPAKLAADEKTTDTLNVANPLNIGLNATVNIQYFITPRLKVGFNIDAIGVGFGAKNSANFISSDNTNTGQHPTTLDAQPNTVNVLLVGDNDIGYLRSEFFVGYAISEKLWIRAGMEYTFAEYTTVQKLTNDNDRFRYKANLFFIGASFNL